MGVASKRGSTEEFSPWPPFVDIFASTIMVLLLFMLILFSLIAHYAELAKENVNQTPIDKTKQQTPEKGDRIRSLLEVKDVIFQSTIVVEQNKTVERAVEDIGGALSFEKEKKESIQEFSDKDMTLVFKNMDIFIDQQLLSSVKTALTSHLQKDGSKKIFLLVGDPKQALSATYAKQISLGRVINLKNKLEKDPLFKDRVSISIDTKEEAKHPYGHILIMFK